jgi:hypothetical protein
VHTRHPLAIELLHQCVGILLELGTIRDALPEINREQIVRALREREYPRAEDLLTTFQLAIKILQESTMLLKEIPFAEYRAFVREIAGCADDFSKLSKENAREAMRANEDYRALHGEFDALVVSVDDLIAWLQDNWPENEWGDKHLPIAKGIVATQDELIHRIKSDETSNPFDAVEELIRIKDKLMAFIGEVRTASGKEWHDTSYEGTLEERLAAWEAALIQLGFSKHDNPTEREIKKAFRTQARKHHEDVWDKDPDESVRKEHGEIFRLCNDAYATLLKSKPE